MGKIAVDNMMGKRATHDGHEGTIRYVWKRERLVGIVVHTRVGVLDTTYVHEAPISEVLILDEAQA